MQEHIRLQLQGKILKFTRQLDEYSTVDYKTGLTYGELTHRMWYFIRKHKITDEEIYKILRRLESQGFIVLTMKNGQLYIEAPKLAMKKVINKKVTENESGINELDTKVKPTVSPELFKEIEFIAYQRRNQQIADAKQAEAVLKRQEPDPKLIIQEQGIEKEEKQ